MSVYDIVVDPEDPNKPPLDIQVHEGGRDEIPTTLVDTSDRKWKFLPAQATYGNWDEKSRSASMSFLGTETTTDHAARLDFTSDGSVRLEIFQ